MEFGLRDSLDKNISPPGVGLSWVSTADLVNLLFIGLKQVPVPSSHCLVFTAMLGETAPPTIPINGEWIQLLGAWTFGGFP